MTDEYIYTIRINRILKKKRRSIDTIKTLSFVDKECFFAWIKGVSKQEKNIIEVIKI
jgi:glycerol-3-phosphate responsive antiterminator